MHDVIPTIRGSDRYLLAISLACFAVAGVTNVAVGSVELTLGATVLAIAGVYCIARYAGSVDRRTLAQTALGLWVGFLLIASSHAVGLEAVGSMAPGPTRVTVVALTAVTWATLLSAIGSTIFLGFREYASPSPAENQVIDGDASDYFTR
ncbi:hypothetical protein [Natrinema halophilum]|uniref:Uncharacterized protein n=1 Tax=Natrinema halophilum TaxID=1699371 RepID=A0A7D5GKH2_9EURY|nr:hypothetical protein [Natrinema halophilum]QLG51267.1 hypothetical protein HYG82_17450 [Natrinema halophilum]